MLKACVWTLAFLGLLSAPVTAQTYVQATVDARGQLHILTQDRREIVPKKEPEQVGFDLPQISPDDHAVGWLEMYPNCCTSYPIPLALVIYAHGKLRKYRGSGLPVWQWRFEAQGKQVAFEQETVHGGMGVHYELHDVKTGRLLAKYDPPFHSADSGDIGTPPRWVAEMN